MRKTIKDFCVRGLMGAWGGPVITAIVWAIMQKNGTIESLSVNEVVTGILTMTVMAFVAGGVSIVYQIETMPKSFAALIQAAVLYADYLGFYLLNGWLPFRRILAFTGIFTAVFVLIWCIIFIATKQNVKQINQLMDKD